MTAIPSDFSRIVAHLDRLETQNRRLKRALAAAVLLAGTVFLMGSQRAAEERRDAANGFTLQDKNGKERARMAMGPDGPALQFLDEHGQTQATFGMGRGGMVMRLVDARGRLRTGLSVEPTGVAIVSVDETGRLFVGANALKQDAGVFAPPPPAGRR